MASWMVHLRVADELLKKIENLDEQAEDFVKRTVEKLLPVIRKVPEK